MNGLIFASVLIVGVMVLALASMVYALGQQQQEHTQTFARLELMLAEMPERLKPLEADTDDGWNHARAVSLASAPRLSGSGRAAIHQRLTARGWVHKPQKAQKGKPA